MKNMQLKAHLTALITILIWGTTFVSTKLLLVDFSPIEILIVRFIIGYAALWLIFPKKLPFLGKKRELLIAAAGLCGITLYYLLENIALTYTLASNVGVICSTAPFFTAILSTVFLRTERQGARFYIGFAIAMAGVSFISFNGGATGTFDFTISPIGDLLALLAAVVWAIYALLTKKINNFGHGAIPITRRTFFYGIVFMLPTLFFMDFNIDPARLIDPQNLLNLLYLGLGASAACFVSWNFAVKWLGSVKTSVYIYIVPVVTVISSFFILNEPINAMTATGIALTLAGLFLSESKSRTRDLPQSVE